MNASANQPPSAKEIFFAALEIEDAQERGRYIDEACQASESLRGEVLELLGANPETNSNAFAQACAQLNPDVRSQSAEAPPTVSLVENQLDATRHPLIGRYKVLEEIGRGGMGTVYMAQQTEPVKRKVALKVINPGMDSREVIARFEAERQALAMMDHAHIARVLDAGATDEGRPYFVMELVRGIPITDYCQQQQLGLDERLSLFADVCQAVQHAHQKGIIHRDLKPSNVMISDHDGAPIVKVIDFGVAKALHQDLTEKTLFTKFSQLVGTPLYMSPEQAQLSGLDVDTRSDIYALGVLLYELLTGTTPFDRDTLARAGIDAARRIICEEVPPRPSTRLSTLAPTESQLKTNSPKEVQRAAIELRDELDWIVMKALEKDRRRRYESASAMAADIQRYLQDEPVEACPPSLAYRTRKFVERNKSLAALIATVTLGLLATIIALYYGLNRAAEERNRAQSSALLAKASEQEALQAAEQARLAAEREQKALQAEATQRKEAERALAASQEVAEFFSREILGQATAFAQSSKGFKPKSELTVREALGRASGLVESRFSKQPSVEFQVRFSLGIAYGNLGVLQAALKHLRRADELAEQLEELDPEQVFLVRLGLAAVLTNSHLYEQSIPLLEKLLAQKEPLGEKASEDLRDIVAFLSNAYSLSGMHDRAIELAKQQLKRSNDIHDQDDIERVSELNILGLALYRAGRYSEAIPYHTEELEILKLHGGRENIEYGTAANNLANDYAAIDDFEMSVKWSRESLEAQTAFYSENHWETILSMTNLATNLRNANHLVEAGLYANQALDLAETYLERNHSLKLLSMQAKARVDAEQGRLFESINLLEKANGIYGGKQLHDSKDGISARRDMGRYLMKWGSQVKALEVLEAASIDAANFYHSLSKRDVVKIRRFWSSALQLTGDSSKALEITRATLKELEEDFPKGHKDTLLVQGDLALLKIVHGETEVGLAELAQSWEQTKDRDHGQSLAEQYFQNDRVEEALAQINKNLAEARSSLPESGLVLADVLADSAQLLRQMQKIESAEPLLREALAIRQEKLPDLWKTDLTRCQLGGVLLEQGKLDEAEPLLLEGCQGLEQHHDSVPLVLHDQFPESLQRLIRLYEEKGDANRAAHWRQVLEGLPTPQNPPENIPKDAEATSRGDRNEENPPNRTGK